MMTAAYGMLTTPLVVLVVAVYAMVSRWRRIRPTRLPKRLGRATSRPPCIEPLRLQYDRTRSVPRDYKTARSPINAKGLRLFADRLQARRAQRRREQWEFQAWLEITSEPLW